MAEQRAVGGAADGAGTNGAAARKGADLVPFLAARHRAVDEAVDEMFGASAHQEPVGPGDRRGGLELRPRRRRPGQPA